MWREFAMLSARVLNPMRLLAFTQFYRIRKVASSYRSREGSDDSYIHIPYDG